MAPEEFRTWRERMGWTQEETAAQLGISRRMTIAYEKGEQGKNRPSPIPRSIFLATQALELKPELQKS